MRVSIAEEIRELLCVLCTETAAVCPVNKTSK